MIESGNVGRTTDVEEYTEQYMQQGWPYSKDLFTCLERLAATANHTGESSAVRNSTATIMGYEIRQRLRAARY